MGTRLCTVDYDYPAFHLNMQCFWASIKAGTPVLREHEDARWLTRAELKSVAWLPADAEVAERIVGSDDTEPKRKALRAHSIIIRLLRHAS